MIFAPAPQGARVFALPPGADFATALADGLAARLAPLPPEARARVRVLVNSARLQRQLRTALAARGPGLLPRIGLVDAPPAPPGAVPPPAAVAPLRRRLELAQLVARLLAVEPDLAPRSAVFDLAETLAQLFAEMQGEGVGFDALDRLDVSRHSGHWARSLRFLQAAQTAIAPDAPDAEGRLRAQVHALTDAWDRAPPPDPVIVAGSTGSRGPTALLMQAVARLPQGAVVLPGFDDVMPDAVWDRLDAAAEDHPQHRFHTLLGALGLRPADVAPWHPVPAVPRRALVSLALRPAPVTDQWLQDGPKLGELAAATDGLALIEAPGPRAEATAIAHRLRDAAAEGQRAALITPDRTLARRVSAMLDTWGVRADDSAGQPLGLSPPGRFLQQVAALLAAPPELPAVLALLKHPLTHSGAGRGPHLLHSRDLELFLRRQGLPWDGGGVLARFAPDRDARSDWAAWLAATLPARPLEGAQPLPGLVARHRALAEALAAGPEGAAHALWAEEAGAAARAAMEELAAQAPHGGAITAADYLSLVANLLAGRAVRAPVAAHPDIMIWGTIEARLQGADLLVLGGLNEGVWPQAPAPDPWLNRAMRAEAGLRAPDRQIGLSAHDFQQGVCAPEVVLTRAIRTAEAQTVPSRWVNRLTNLLAGLPAQGGPAALDAMRARGQHWQDIAAQFDTDMRLVPADPPAPRPAPAPPVRPRRLSVTQVEMLIRDPYAIYARHVLGLQELGALQPVPDALLRGTVLHQVLEAYTAPGQTEALPDLARAVLARLVPWPAARALWAARLDRVGADFAHWQACQPGTIALREARGDWALGTPDFTLTARADRMDVWPDGRLHIIDYKTGTPPTPKEQKLFAKQLLLQALMAEAGAFADLGARPVARVSYLGVGGRFAEVATDFTPATRDATRDGLARLLAAYLDPAQGFTARRAPRTRDATGPYDHLARFGEWTMQDRPRTIPVGDHDG